MPGLLFSTTYTLLVLFCAEIYYQVSSKLVTHVVPKHYVYLFFHMYFEVIFFGYNLTMENVYFIQARAITVDGYRPAFMTINGIIYLIQVKISHDN